MSFIAHLHVHDEFSPLDGSGTANQLACEAARNGQTHLGRTNHGRLGGILEHIDACRHPEKYDDPHDETRKRSKDERIMPVLGMEAFWRPNRFMELPKGDEFGQNPHNWAQHLCLHARSLAGWQTLMRLSSKSWIRREQGGGYYGKPCIDMGMLREDHEGIIISTACVQSPSSQLILAGDENGAKKWCQEVISIVGPDNFFFELMAHDFDLQQIVNIGVINIAHDLGQPIIATSDVHIPYANWADTHEVVRMSAYSTTVTQQDKKKEAGEEVYTERIDTVFMASDEELSDQFADNHPDLPSTIVSEALNNTEVFCKRISMFTIGKATKLPKVTANDKEAEYILREWLDEGRRKRIRQWDEDGIDESEIKRRNKEYDARQDHELGVLKSKGVLDYFIMVGRMVKWAKSTDPLPGTKIKKRPIRVGLGRGSAAGSLVSYDIGITAVDPIAWGLLFERFLNPDRVGLPDIDIDFETDLPILMGMDGRELVKEYLRRTYGHDHVADIIAYQTFAPRAVIKNVGATQDLGYKELDKVTETIGETERNLSKIVKTNPVVAAFAEEHPFVWKQCLRLEDQVMRDTKHAGGVLITPKPVSTYMPTQLGTDEESTVTAWSDRAEFPIVSDYGFVKWDILGVRSLSKQQMAVELIKEHYGEEVDPNDLPSLRDPERIDQNVLDGFVSGMTLGIFQFGSSGITQLLRKIRPTTALDIAVANALYRPGPIKVAMDYADRKNGRVPEDQWYWHDAVEPVLKETLGVVAFQEQVMEITKVIGNFSGGEADSMRKAMSKMYRLPGDEAQQFMNQWYEKWMQGCRDNSLMDNAANTIWQGILAWGEYGFNKAHAGGYGLQAVQDMWLKVNYPVCMYPAILTIEKKNKAEEQVKFVKGVLREARVLDVDVLPPDVNYSDKGWTVVHPVDERKIRFGLISIKDMGSGAFDEIRDEREKKLFDNYRDFVGRMPSNFSVRQNVSLVKGGAFDSIDDREYLLSPVRKIEETKRKFKVVMTCGCKKQKTVNLEKTDVETAMDELRCTKKNKAGDLMHEDGRVQEFNEVDPFVPCAQMLKEQPDIEPEIERDIDRNEMLAMEQEVLSFPYSLSETQAMYDDFLKDRIYTEEEFEALPPKPNRKKDKHGTWCSCEDCNAAECVVGGEIINVKEIVTRGGDKMAFLDIAFGTNHYNVTVFNWLWLKKREIIKERPTVFLIAGHKSNRDDNVMAYEIADVVEVAAEEGWEPPESERDSHGNKNQKRNNGRGKTVNRISRSRKRRDNDRRGRDKPGLVVKRSKSRGSRIPGQQRLSV